MRWNNREKYAYYGTALLIVILIIAGLLISLKSGKKEKKPEGNKARQEQAGKDQKEAEKPDEAVQNPNIRVLLKSTGYQDIVHPEVALTSDHKMMLTYGEESQEVEPGGILTLSPDDERFQKGNLRVQAADGGKITVLSLERGYGNPNYKGVMELRTTAEGIIMINELPAESYLCKVVPSEMPASYELEALKAQAVCARSYAYRQMQDYAYPEYEAHVNDSTDYQVYGNSEDQESSNRAVEETKGQVVRYNGNIVTTYYYSTSCGKTTSMEAWGTAPNDDNGYLKSVEVRGENGDYEKDLAWYRWEAAIPVQTLSDLISLNTQTEVGTLSSLEVTRTGPGGVALEITATGDAGSVTVETENKIRRALAGGGYQITKQDGTSAECGALLPSAFFTIELSGGEFLIHGGGFGHGIGMSQNGANEMAKQGKNYQDILGLFFPGVEVK